MVGPSATDIDTLINRGPRSAASRPTSRPNTEFAAAKCAARAHYTKRCTADFDFFITLLEQAEFCRMRARRMPPARRTKLNHHLAAACDSEQTGGVAPALSLAARAALWAQGLEGGRRAAAGPMKVN